MRPPLLARAAPALAGLALAFASSAPAGAQPSQKSPEKLAEAKEHMEAGAAFYNDPSGHKCEEAYREFSKAYELSGSLNALKGMGVCALELERDGDAIAHFDKYLAGKGARIDAADKAQVESDLKALKAAVAWVTLKAERPGTRVTDVRTPSRGAPISNSYVIGPEGLKVGIHPGAHVLTATADGAPDVVWRVDIANGGTYDHTFEVPKAQPQPAAPAGGAPPIKDKDPTPPPAGEPEMERPVPASVFIFGGLTVAAAVPMAIFMIKAKGDKADYDEQNNGTLPEADVEDLRSKVTTSNMLADIFLGVTAASAVTTGILFFTRPSVPVEKTGSEQTGSWRLTPVVAPSGGAAFVTGRF
ncbi:MAG: hypothetical protein IT372_31400 [Polyangiaceae bacterium]|nr:hypothetical protein [Polyangiaceae bacterium]